MAPPLGSPSCRYTTYPSEHAYNKDHPAAQIPADTAVRNAFRGYTCAGLGLRDDLAGTGEIHILDFLPGGAPQPGAPDRLGTVVATRWGSAPCLVLAEHVSLRRAWEAVTGAWPAELSAAAEALRPLVDAPAPPGTPAR